MESIIITSEADLRQLIREILHEEIKNLLPYLERPTNVVDECLMTRVEMAGYLKISLVTLNDWVKRGLPCIRKGGRVLFQKSEVIEAIKDHNSKSVNEEKDREHKRSK